LFAAAKAVREAVTVLKRENTLDATEPLLMPLPEYYALVGLEQQHEREQGYERAAAAVVNKRAAE
jgi:methylisocitrate lyase